MKDKNLLINSGIDVDKSLELFGDMETYNETLNEFLDSVDDKVEALTKHKEASDAYNYAIYAHSLKSDARYLGFTKLAELAYNHEMAGKSNDIDYIYNNYESLINEVKRIVKVVCDYVGVRDNIIKEENTVHSDKVILVVDDSDIVQNFIKKIFNNMYEVRTASNGEEALNYIYSDTDNKIIGMFLDLNMPKVNGFQVLEYFDKNNLFQKIPVAIITGVDTKDEISRTLMYPIVDILSKPFNETNVKSVIDKMTKED